MTEPVRLAKRLAEMLSCSRREAEQYIEGGWVSVDGVTIEEPQFRVSNQTIVLDKDASLLAMTPVTLLLHKPAGQEAHPDGGVAQAAGLLSAATQSPDDRSGIRPCDGRPAAWSVRFGRVGRSAAGDFRRSGRPD